MRTTASGLFAALAIALLICLVSANRSKKPFGKYVAFVVTGLSLPVIGNLILVASSNKLAATIGCYIYFLGMDTAVYSLLFFAHAYCGLGKPRKWVQLLVDTLLLGDLLHYILNPFLHLSFDTEKILVDGRDYYRLIPYIGQTYHRIVCYGIFLAVLIIFLVKAIKSARIYAEKYWLMMFAMGVTGAVESYYIFSRKPIDMSMIGFGLFGLLVYVFVLYYSPMKQLQRMLAGIASDMQDALFFFDTNGKCIWINEPGKNLIGIAKDNYEDVKVNLRFLFGDIDFDNSGWCNKITLGEGDEAQYTYIEMRGLYDEKGNSTGTYLIVRDITQDQLQMKREMYSSTHDSLTGFYTKEHLYSEIEKRLRKDKETDYMIGYMKIVNLNIINDVFGGDFAELTIKTAADFILEGISKKCLYGRLSGDSFGILIDKEDFLNKPVKEKISGFTVKDDNLEHHVLINYGVYDIDEGDKIDVPLFFDSARLATAVIKDNYTDRVAFYDDKLRNEIIHNQLISNQVRDAIKTRQIRPYLQPIVNGQGLLEGAEALVRWIHPEEGFMSPGMFIPVFERNGLIGEVDKHMWRCACEILADWKKRGIEAFISVNISPKDFYLMDVVSELKSLVEEHGIDPVKLRVEITETVMADGAFDMLSIINELRDYGFIVEMDDFGSGYSSLNLLKDMNIDVIKIDMQFLKDSERNMKVGTIIKSIIDMSKGLNIDTLTEGVETAKQFENLFSMGCKLYQGYYFSKPVPLEDFEKQWFD